MNLWKFNRLSGLWDHQRTCNPDLATMWLQVFQGDEPGEFFELAKHRPKHNPFG